MKRYDLRPLKDNFLTKMVEIMNSEITDGENGIFLFEIGDFSSVQASADTVKENNWTLMNSLKFNEVDWTVVIKKEKPVAIVEEEPAANEQ
ncbi:MAG: NADH-ubiquinone oxidoreductase subunit E family protein [Campylobacterota bacterium]|nr:NADH-ubiquinone oxidoreductase subunit E family protein [Campylobacterota bacterium]